MTRSSHTVNLKFDLDPDRTLHRLRREARQNLTGDESTSEGVLVSSSGINIALEYLSDSSSSDLEEEAMAANRTLKELAAPDLNQQPLCIDFPTLEAVFELKSGLIHLLPEFCGLAREDPHKHLKEFHVVCSSMKPQGISEEQIKLRAFPFSLDEYATDWLYYLPSGTINSWNEMKHHFLEKYFPASKAANIRKEICGIRQNNGETLYEYWEHFKKLCASCPHH